MRFGQKVRGWLETAVGVTEVLKGQRPFVVAGFGECEKVCGERPLVKAKVMDGKRPLRLRSVQAVFHYNVRH